MIAEAGHGAAMPTAPAAVRAAGRYLAPPLAEEGAAQLIEELVLADPQSAADGRRASSRPSVPAPRVTARVVPDDAAGSRRRDPRPAKRRHRRAADGHRLRHRRRARRGSAASSACSRRSSGPPDWAIMLLLDAADQARAVGAWPPAAAALAGAFWPGGLTIVVDQLPGANLPPELTAGRPTIGLRVPDHALSPGARGRGRAAAGHLGQPVGPAAGPRRRARSPRSSAMRWIASSTADRPTAARASTVVDCTVDPVRILRVGAVPEDDVAACLARAASAASRGCLTARTCRRGPRTWEDMAR